MRLFSEKVDKNIKNNLLSKLNIKSFDDYELIDISSNSFIVFEGEGRQIPILSNIMNNPKLSNYFINLDKGVSYFLSYKNKEITLKDENEININIPNEEKEEIMNIINLFKEYGGYLNDNGEHIINLKCPNCGIHYGVNLLIGDRTHYDHPLQSTPKSVVDYLGRGSFRGHSTFQVLATSWGLNPEENGHPCNRQFYLVEDGKQIFYSASIDESIEKAYTTHSQNRTYIHYVLKCGLEVKRTIFIAKQYDDLPCALEIQTIEIKNNNNKSRKIDIVYTNMFGSSNPDTQKIDVIYSTLITETKVYRNQEGQVVAITPSYYPEYCRREIRFTSLRSEGEFSTSFASDINKFIGNGTLNNPQRVTKLSNECNSKGPNFIALGKTIELGINESKSVDTFTGVVDATKTSGNDDIKLFEEQLNNMLNKFNNHESVLEELDNIIKDCDKYASFLQIKGYEDKNFISYVNKNLPFQVYYQTYVSRSFAMTQKGYREIGFREIQDIFASMYYLVSKGEQELVKKLLIQWSENVYQMGYANHNFYYVGKEPGMCSDDQLWLVQAIHRYVELTGDKSILKQNIKVAGSSKTRKLYDTLKAIIAYSSDISVGKHGLPLLDSADWNDCLKIDVDYLDGPVKEKAYKKQIRKNKTPYGVAFESDYSESVMNGFLLSIALDHMISFAKILNDSSYIDQINEKSTKLRKSLIDNAYINDYFARVLINRENKNNVRYIGSIGDKLSLDENLDGSYYLNSFSWSLLSNIADEEQISKMLDAVEKHLKTPAGFKLCTKHDLSLAGASGSATDQYKPGDRENGGVFKHATMMAVVGMLKQSKKVKSLDLKKRLIDNAYFMLDIVMPYRTLNNPYFYKGNPRFCTQYNNSVTEENIGPILSGTSSWLTLALMEMLGVEITIDGVYINPALREEISEIKFELKNKGDYLLFEIYKNKGELCDINNASITVDGIKGSAFIPNFNDGKKHVIVIKY